MTATGVAQRLVRKYGMDGAVDRVADRMRVRCEVDTDGALFWLEVTLAFGIVSEWGAP